MQSLTQVHKLLVTWWVTQLLVLYTKDPLLISLLNQSIVKDSKSDAISYNRTCTTIDSPTEDTSGATMQYQTPHLTFNLLRPWMPSRTKIRMTAPKLSALPHSDSLHVYSTISSQQQPSASITKKAIEGANCVNGPWVNCYDNYASLLKDFQAIKLFKDAWRNQR